MLRKHLVIVGGGWGGLALARQLKNQKPESLRITLISDGPNFRYTPALYRVAAGHREREAILPISEITNDLPNVDFVVDAAKKIDRAARTITTASGKTYHYDYAVVTLGMVTSYFNIPGLKEHSFGIKSLPELRKLREHLHQEIIMEREPDKNYIVVGAGPTGIELGAAMAHYLRKLVKKHRCRRQRVAISVIEAAPRVCPTLHPRASKLVKRRLRKLGVKVMLNEKVEAETETSLQVSGVSIPTETVIWTAGVTMNLFFANNKKQFAQNERGKIIVDEWLQVDERTYVIGDNAATAYSGLAFTAVHNAKFVAKDIGAKLRAKQKRTKYRPFTPVSVIPVGSRWSVVQYRSIVFGGWPAAVLRTLADYIGYADILGYRKALSVWWPSVSDTE